MAVSYTHLFSVVLGLCLLMFPVSIHIEEESTQVHQVVLNLIHQVGGEAMVEQSMQHYACVLLISTMQTFHCFFNTLCNISVANTIYRKHEELYIVDYSYLKHTRSVWLSQLCLSSLYKVGICRFI